jgi:hypothetical protein
MLHVENIEDFGPGSLTLLDLVAAVSEAAEGDEETVETIRWMLASGRVRLRGCFNETHACGLALQQAGEAA